MNKYLRIKPVLLSSLSAIALLLAVESFAEVTAKPEKLIQWRQSAYRLAEWNVARIKSNLEGTYNKAEVQAAANTLASIANSGLPTLFAANTDKGKGWHDTAARPEVFKDKAKFSELSNNFSKEAAELVKVATSSNDAAGIKEQFGKVTRTCKACHDDFKGDD